MLSVVLLLMFGALVYLERRVHRLEEGQARMEGKLDMLLQTCPLLHRADSTKAGLAAPGNPGGPGSCPCA